MDKGKRKINTGGKVSKPSVLLFHFEGQGKIWALCEKVTKQNKWKELPLESWGRGGGLKIKFHQTANLFESSDIFLIQLKSFGFLCLVSSSLGARESLKYVARELFDLFAKIYKVRGSECQNNNSEKHCRSSYRVHISHKLMHYSEKMSPRRLIRSRSNARKCSRHVVHRASKFSIFLLLFLWVVAFFSPPPPSPPPGPSRFELYYVSQMHSSLWWHNSSWWLDLGKAAVRTGYLANVLSRPSPGTIESEQEGERDRKKKENTTKKETWDPVGKSLLGSALEEGGRWICRVMSVIWSQSIILGQYGFFISLLLQLFFFPPAPLLSHFLSLWASKLAWQPCTAAPTAVRRSTADPALYQPDWSHLASLLPPLCCPVGSRERGVRVRPTQGHGTGCKALAKSNMALIVFAGWSPLVCFCLPCPRGFSSRLGHKFPHTHMHLFLRSHTHSVFWGGNCQFGENNAKRPISPQ